MPDGALSDMLGLTVTSGLPAGAVPSWLFIKEISALFGFPPLPPAPHSYEFQTFSSSTHKRAPL